MDSQPPIEPEGLFDGLRVGAIVFGALVDNLATLMALGFVFSVMAPEAASESTAATEKALEELFASTTFWSVSTLVGAACTVLGAFFGARMAGQVEIKHGGWIALTSTALSLLFLLPQPEPGTQPPAADYPLWAETLSWLLILPAGMLGGFLAKRFPTQSVDDA